MSNQQVTGSHEDTRVKEYNNAKLIVGIAGRIGNLGVAYFFRFNSIFLDKISILD